MRSKQNLLTFSHRTRQKLLRVKAVIAVIRKLKAVESCLPMQEALARHTHALEDVPDRLFANQTVLPFVSAPLFDVQSAYAIFRSGRFELPSFLEDAALPKAPPRDEAALLTAAFNATVLNAVHSAHLPERMTLLKARAPPTPLTTCQ